MSRTPDTPPVPPVAEKRPRSFTLHGETLRDDYFWLREKENPAVLAQLEAENRYCDAVMAPTAGLQAKLYQEMLGRIQETDLGVPYHFKGFHYYSRTAAGLQYPIYCRRRGTLEAPEEIILDLNQLAVGQAFMGLGLYEVSDDGRWLAYAVDTTGFRQYTLHLKDLLSGETGPEAIPRVVSVAWAADSRTLFYGVEDEQTKRACRLYRHIAGTAGGEAADPRVLEEADEKFSLDVSRSRSGDYIFLNSSSHTAAEVSVLAADRPEGVPRLIAPRRADHDYRVAHRGGLFYIRSNRSGRNYELATAPVDDPAPERWRVLVPHRPEVMLEDVDCFRDHVVLSERSDGLPRLRIMDAGSGESHLVEFPEPAYSLMGAYNPEFDTHSFRFSYQSLKTPLSVFDYDMATRERTLRKRFAVLGGYDPENYITERVSARAPDGTAVPVSLIYRKGLKREGGNPLLLYGYGAYGMVASAGFSSNRVSLLDRGVVYAIAHVRGGGDLGKPWHDGGRMLNKLNSFTDLLACAEHLIAAGYARPDALAIEGGSAGGLLVTAAANLRPELLRAVVARVPFTDVINSMSDETLPLTVGEFEEWGDPKIREHYDTMKRYCPYSNLAEKKYPAMLVKTSFNDSQVMYWEPAKYVAKLRPLNRGELPILFKCNMAGGHGGASGRYDQLHDLAFDYAFILTQLGIPS